MEGLGVGFMSFLDEIDTLVKDADKLTKKYKKKEYAFNDDAKEVALDEEQMANALMGMQDDDQQSGFSGDMQMAEDAEQETLEDADSIVEGSDDVEEMVSDGD